MKQPIVAKCFSLAGSLAVTKRRLRDSEQSNTALAHSMRVLSERHTALGVDRDGWRSRALALYAACPAEVREGVLGTLDTIDNLPVVEGPRSAP
jgi:hypothetical protein